MGIQPEIIVTGPSNERSALAILALLKAMKRINQEKCRPGHYPELSIDEIALFHPIIHSGGQ